jgi:penicillin amidase
MLSQIASRPRHDVGDLRRMQLDIRSLWAAGIVERVLRPYAQRACALDIHIDGALAQVAAWDGEADSGSCAAAIFYAFIRAFAGRLLRSHLSDELATAYLELMHEAIVPIERILGDEASPWFTLEQRPIGAGQGGYRTVDRDTLIGDAMADAVAFLRERFGDDPTRWRWGALHTLTHRHPLGKLPAVSRLFTIGPFETGGDGTTVSNGEYNLAQPFDHIVGAAMRMVIDVGNWDRSGLVLSTGQSGRPLSPHYKDQAELWKQGKLCPWPFTKSAVEDATAKRVVYRPAKPSRGSRG